jgi:hypothetical protein
MMSLSRRHMTVLRALGLAFLVAGALLALAFSRPSPASAVTPVVTAPSGQLTAKWWQQAVSVTAKTLNDPTTCALGTDDVVFLVGTLAQDRACTIEAGQSILIPLINVECSSLEGDGTTSKQLADCSKRIANDFTDMFATLTPTGGDPIALEFFRVKSGAFQFTAVGGNYFRFKANVQSLSAADGYWTLVGPLPPGTYEISFGGAYGDFLVSATYTITVK